MQREVAALAADLGGGEGVRGGLEEEDGLRRDEEAERLEQRVRRDEREARVREDGDPDYREQDDAACLGEPAGSFWTGFAG